MIHITTCDQVRRMPPRDPPQRRGQSLAGPLGRCGQDAVLSLTIRNGIASAGSANRSAAKPRWESMLGGQKHPRSAGSELFGNRNDMMIGPFPELAAFPRRSEPPRFSPRVFTAANRLLNCEVQSQSPSAISLPTGAFAGVRLTTGRPERQKLSGGAEFTTG